MICTCSLPKRECSRRETKTRGSGRGIATATTMGPGKRSAQSLPVHSTVLSSARRAFKVTPSLPRTARVISLPTRPTRPTDRSRVQPAHLLWIIICSLATSCVSKGEKTLLRTSEREAVGRWGGSRSGGAGAGGDEGKGGCYREAAKCPKLVETGAGGRRNWGKEQQSRRRSCSSPAYTDARLSSTPNTYSASCVTQVSI